MSQKRTNQGIEQSRETEQGLSAQRKAPEAIGGARTGGGDVRSSDVRGSDLGGRSHFSARRLAGGAALILLLLFAALASARVGAGRMIARYGLGINSLSAARRATLLSTADPEVSYTNGALLSQAGEYALAGSEFERTVALRPGDYFVWLQLGRARDDAGYEEGAERALREASRLAPYYSEPRWQLGNLLFRLGRQDEAFDELRRAARSQPSLLPAFIDLAWQASGKDAATTQSIVEPRGKGEQLMFARFLAKQGNAEASAAIIRDISTGTDKERRELLGKYLKEGKFAEAHEVWMGGSDGGAKRGGGASAITDSGFEGALLAEAPGFDWRSPKNTAGYRIAFDRDAGAAANGAQALRIDFDGAANPQTRLITQLVLVDPRTTYQLSFAARTKELVSGGLPIVVVADARTNNAPALAATAPLAGGTNQWRRYTMNFTTGETSRGIYLYLQREKCGQSLCPAFGQLWLDDFVLTRK